jgi:integrase/recombinase XerD
MAGGRVIGQVSTMSGLRDLMDGYLATRRALGFKLVAPGKTLDAFVGWMEDAGEPTIRRGVSPIGWCHFLRGSRRRRR